MALKYSILGLLHYRPMHGYRIKKHIEQHFGYMWSVNYGQIYPNLKRLQEEGLVLITEVAPGAKGPEKKLYSITPKGREAFAEWLHASPERGMLIRDPFLMRFVFFGFGEKDRAMELIDQQIKEYDRQLKKRRENLPRWLKHDVHVRLVAELGVKFNRMVVKWLKEARAELEKEDVEG